MRTNAIAILFAMAMARTSAMTFSDWNLVFPLNYVAARHVLGSQTDPLEDGERF
jgi:hypothetical protein